MLRSRFDGSRDEWTVDELFAHRGGVAHGAWEFWTEAGELDAARSGWYERGARVRGL